MAGINNNLYPPIFNKPYMPAFVRQNGCRIYFSISIYNSLSEMHHPAGDINTVDAVQLIVQKQKTNQSALSESLYPSGIKLTTLGIDNNRNGNDIYYVDILNSDIQGGFNFNEYYKVQVRFTSINAEDPPQTGLDQWLGFNLASFSQWSTVVLIKAISNPTLQLNNFNQESDSTSFTINDIVIAGRVNFNSQDYEKLQSYRIKIYTQDESTVLQDSGDIFLNAYNNLNQIEYRCKYDFQSDVNYILGIQILTQNLYSWPEQQKFKFNINFMAYTVFDASISAEKDNVAGRIKIHLEKDSVLPLGTNIIIRRSSNKNNFKIWEDVYTFLVPANTVLNFDWYDYTVESGVWYSYRAEQRNKEGFRSTNVQIANPIMVLTEDIFLMADSKQLKIRFDPDVTNFAHTVSQSLTETIGSKYPFIRRNGNVNYRTFSLSGTITYFMDLRENLMQASRQDLYNTSLSLYDNFNKNNNINLFNDVILERDFRKQVINFLYKNNVKLYKSSTEGNILVKLMNINFTPNKTLGRQIYSFTCTAYEIDDFNYENCVKYNVQSQGEYKYQTSFLIDIYGQICRPTKNLYYKQSGERYNDRFFSNQQYFSTNELINTVLVSKYKKLTTDTIDVSIDHLSYLKIQFTSKPYLIGINNSGNPYQLAEKENSENAIYLGHIIQINGQYIIVNKDGIYELLDDGTNITSLRFVSPKETGMISFEATLTEKEKEGSLPKQYSTFNRVGQFWGSFNIQDSIYRKIVNKYNQSYSISLNTEDYISEDTNSLYEQQVQTISGIRIQSQPGIVFYLKQSQDSDMERHIIGDTGLLQFYDDNSSIQGLYFIGPHLLPAINNNFAQDNQFIQTDLIYDSFQQIIKPIKNGVYTIINTQSDPDENLLSTQGLNISQQDLETIAALAQPAVDQNKIKLSTKIKNWLENSSYIQNLSSKEKKDLINILYQTVLKQYIASGNKYIYYHGGWYHFTQNNDVQINSIEAIIDYYCTILRMRF